METKELIHRIVSVIDKLKDRDVDKHTIRELEYIVEDLMMYKYTNI